MVRSESKQAVGGMSDVHAVEVQSDWLAPPLVNNIIFPLKANLITWSEAQNLKERPEILNKTVALKTDNGQSVETKGTFRLTVKHQHRLHHVM